MKAGIDPNGTYLSLSFLRRQESIGLESTVFKIPACAGMTIFFSFEA
jgi:hypothetical protein